MITAQEAKEQTLEIKGFNNSELAIKNIEEKIKNSVNKGLFYCNLNLNLINNAPKNIIDEIKKTLEENGYGVEHDVYGFLITWDKI